MILSYCLSAKRLSGQGNTVVVIEHNLDVIKSSDWIVDLGPDGGSDGGEVVAFGPPKAIVKNKSPIQENI